MKMNCKLNNQTRLAFVLLILFQISISGVDAQDFKDEFIERLKASNKEINSIESNFIQERVLSIMEEVQVSSGEFYYKKPDYMKWDQQEPSKYYFILNQDKVIRFDGKNIKVVPANSPQVSHFKDFIIGAVSGSLFENKLYSTEITKNGEKVMVVLIPQQRNMSKRIERIHLEFDYDRMFLVNLELVEKDGDKTIIRFSDQKLNTIADLTIFN